MIKCACGLLAALFAYAPWVCADPAAPTASVLGVAVPVDEQGRPVLDDATRAALRAQIRDSFARKGVSSSTGTAKRRADGSETIASGLDQMALSVARVDDAGELELACVQGDAAAVEFLAQGKQ